MSQEIKLPATIPFLVPSHLQSLQDLEDELDELLTIRGWNEYEAPEFLRELDSSIALVMFEIAGIKHLAN